MGKQDIQGHTRYMTRVIMGKQDIQGKTGYIQYDNGYGMGSQDYRGVHIGVYSMTRVNRIFNNSHSGLRNN